MVHCNGHNDVLKNKMKLAILEKSHASQAMVCGLQKEEGFARSMTQRLTEVSSVLQRRCVASKVVSHLKPCDCGLIFSAKRECAVCMRASAMHEVSVQHI